MSDLISRQAAIETLNDGAELLNRVLDETDVVGVERTKYEWGLGLIESCISDMKELPSAEPEIIRCKDCTYYDPPHVENNGERIEYSDIPKDAFDVLGVGLVSVEYGTNIGGRCLRDYNVGYLEDKRVYVPETNYCGRSERRTDERSD